MTKQQAKRLDIPISAAVKCIMQLGVDSSQLVNLGLAFSDTESVEKHS